MRLAGLAGAAHGRGGGRRIVNVITVGAYSGGPGIGHLHLGEGRAAHPHQGDGRGVGAPRRAGERPGAGPVHDRHDARRRQLPGFVEGARNATLQRRIAAPEEIVGSALYLASDASAFVTGEDLVVAGGYRK